jgi:hypothetical protein
VFPANVIPASLFPALVLSCALLIDLPGEPPSYARPVSATRPRYIEFLEDNTQFIYPGIAVLVVTLIALGVISAWRTEDMDGIQKAEVKREIIGELRREIHGVTVDHLAKSLGVPSLKLIRLLDEMREQGITECRTDTRRVTTWRLKGLVS